MLELRKVVTLRLSDKLRVILYGKKIGDPLWIAQAKVIKIG
jgi:hypothetical protein